MVVTVVALARAFYKARLSGDYDGLADGGFRGAANSVAAIAAVGAVGAAGGPTGAALLVGVVVGVLAHKATADVSITDICRFVGDKAAEAIKEARQLTQCGQGPQTASISFGGSN